MDFDGIVSFAQNNNTQMEDVDQTLQADLNAVATIQQTPMVYKNARFREIFADIDDQDAQAILTSAQRQGYLSVGGQPNPSVQAATADGAIAQNNLTEFANANQKNIVTLNGTIDLRREPLEVMTPRSADFHVSMNGDGGAHRAINSNSAVQEQALVQEASGGVEENGCPTENGGIVDNNAMLSQYSKENSTVLHGITVLV
jgi:hypothetical protein